MEKKEVHDANLVVVIGTVTKDATVVETSEGRILTSFEVVCRPGGVRTVVPVTVEKEIAIVAGSRVAVIGRVEKRFHSSGAGSASRTDVRGESVTVLRRASQVRRVLSVAAERLGC